MYSLVFFFIIIVSLVYTFIRYKYLTIYSRLPEDSKRQNPILDTFLEPHEGQKNNKNNYLDEFLAAIKIFGYFDTEVFHELTKSLQTQKLDSGEIIFLDECSGFTICVEGEIQVYSEIGDENQVKKSMFYKEDPKNVVVVDEVRYQLLNIIKPGTPLSSIIDVLNLLTGRSSNPSSLIQTPHVFSFQNQQQQQQQQQQHYSSIPLPSDGFSLDPLADDFRENESSTLPPKSTGMINNSSKLIAIPRGNCTISIIPKESFLRIAMKYPKDASHIIQMILTKLYRVTFQTAHNYLDLTSDIYQTEINLNEANSNTKLPKYLHDLAVNLIKSSENEYVNIISSVMSNNRSKPRKAKNLKNQNVRKSKRKLDGSHFESASLKNLSISSSLNLTSNDNLSQSNNSNLVDMFTSDGDDSLISNDLMSHLENNNNSNFQRPKLGKNKSRHFVLDGRKNTNPGDLLSNVPLPRTKDVNLKLINSKFDRDEIKDRTFSADDEESEESTLITAIAERISKMIGLDKQHTPNLTSIDKMNNNNNNNQNHSMYSMGKSPRMSDSMGIKQMFPAPDNKSKNKSRTFSTTSVEIVDDSSSSNNDIYNSFLNYEQIKVEFENEIKLRMIPKGTKIIKNKEQTSGIFYIIRGGFDVTYWRKESNYVNNYYTDLSDIEEDKLKEQLEREEFLYHANEGDLVGYLGTLIGSKSFFDVTATENTYVAYLSREFFEYLTERYPTVELSIANYLLKVLDRKIYFTDYALEWVHSSAGNSLYSQDEPANGIYIVLNGRFRSIVKKSNLKKDHYQILGEYGQGQSVGEIEVLTKSKRLSTLVAIRDSELARIPRTLFELIALTNPEIIVHISRIVANRVTNDGVLIASSKLDPFTNTNRDEPLVKNFNNYRTITIMPTSAGSVPLEEFGEKLANAMKKIGKNVKILDQSGGLSSLGRFAFDKLAKLKQGGYFAELEEKFDLVIYLSDGAFNSKWTRTCIQQGDCILLLANGKNEPFIGDYERLLVKAKTSARTELVILHPERFVEPGMTNKWLKNRIWIHSYHHIQMICSGFITESHSTVNQFDSLSYLSQRITDNLKKMENILKDTEFMQFINQTKESFKSKKYYRPMQEHKDDFMRLARLLTGQAIGLVLGGGGARGISHVGIIKALEDQGIPVDIIGGTSIGSFVGGLYAKDYDFVPVYGRAKNFSSRMASIWRSLLDLTIPITSYITGHEFNRGIWKAFGDSRIEDFWISYYVNSTNITESTMEIHTSGYAWRYIRASMTLASLLPPITDNGHMLMDGGYIDNLTVSEMSRRGVKHIIAVDVGSEDDKSDMMYGDSLSGWWVLLNRLNPFSTHANVPTMADIQMRLAYVASVRALEKAKSMPGCVYLRPPIEGYATLDFGKFDEIYRVGYSYGEEMAQKLRNDLNFGEKQKIITGDGNLRRRYSI
ncbi:lysophospholipase [Martiniozyma asiatica (nom. inval.)]|nr:lysophospholipase [Martiniozyma asiatica]